MTPRHDLPTVSVLLCTRNRREQLARALQCYLAQDYPRDLLELVVVEDGSDNCSDSLDAIPNCIYLWYPARNLSQKRNAGVWVARGGVICHFDDDDLSAPDRVSHQVRELTAADGDSGPRRHIEVVGYHTGLFSTQPERAYTDMSGPLWEYRGLPGMTWGATLAYRREWALAHPWPEHKDVGEDMVWLAEARDAGVLRTIESGGRIVCGSRENQRVYSTGDGMWERNWSRAGVEWLREEVRPQ